MKGIKIQGSRSSIEGFAVFDRRKEERRRRRSGRVYMDERAGANGATGRQVRDVERKARSPPLFTRVTPDVVCRVTESSDPGLSSMERCPDR